MSEPVDLRNTTALGEEIPVPAEAVAPTASVANGRVRLFQSSTADVSLAVLAVIVVIYMLWWAEPLVVPIALGFVLTSLLEPGVRALRRVRVPRVIGAALLVTLSAAVLSFAAYRATTGAATVVRELPETTKRLRLIVSSYARGDSAVAQLQKAATEIERAADSTRGATPGVTRVEVVERPFDVGNLLWAGSLGMLDAGGRLALALFLTFFLLASGDLFRRKAVRLIGSALSEKRVTVQMLDAMERQVGRFVAHLTVTSVAVGVASWLAYSWIGLEQAAFWGFAAGLLNVIPYVGASLASIGAALAALAQFGTLREMFLVGAFATVITSLEGFLLTPWLLRRASQLNGVATIVGIAFWTWLWGVWGIFLGIPMLMIVKAISDHVVELQPLSDLLGDDVPLAGR
jgi:predicted PurR-regulated permease PerM